MPNCTECLEQLETVVALLLHLEIKHNLSEDSVFKCKEDQCPRVYSSWKTFKKHLIQAHKCRVNPISAKARDKHSTENIRVEQEIHIAGHASDTFIDANPRTRNDDSLSDSVERKFKDVILAFCAKLYSTPDLPRSYVQNMVDNTKELIEQIVTIVKPALCQLLEPVDTNKDLANNTMHVLDAMTAPFQSLSTEYRRLKLLKEAGFVSPRSYIVGETVDDRLVDGQIIKKTVPVHAQFVPLRETLHCFFSLPGVLDSVLNYMTSLSKDNEIISNFIQGTLWREKVNRYFVGKTVIPLFIYYDDFEVNNPLGSHAGIQKLGGVYCSIPCLPPQFCSTLENIFLVLLFHATDRKNFGNANTFRILVDELNYLQEYGIEFCLNGANRTIYFALGLIMGDNLGLNSAFDFVESFTNCHFCRLCTLSGKETAIDCAERSEYLRLPEEYEHDIEKGVKLTGIKKSSVWNEVRFFHIYDNFYMDPLHDIAEGALKYGTAHVLHHYIFDCAKKIPLELVNDRLRTFNYTVNGITNKPPLLRWKEVKDRKLSMSASEMTNFVYVFPLLIGDSITVDRVWEFFTTLRNILFIVAAKSIQPESFVLLEQYVSEHHKLYTELFKDSLKPKHHNMVHYGTVMTKSGPLNSLSTIRHESKNREFKQSANATYSRRNITHTLALKEVFRLGYRHFCKRGLVEKFEIGPGGVIESPSENDFYDSIICSEVKNNWITVPWMISKGISYRVGTCIVMKLDLDDRPVFGVIEAVLCNEAGKVIFECQVYSSIVFNDRFHSWEVQSTNEVDFREITTLFTPFPCIFHRIGSGQHFATAKYAL